MNVSAKIIERLSKRTKCLIHVHSLPFGLTFEFTGPARLFAQVRWNDGLGLEEQCAALLAASQRILKETEHAISRVFGDGFVVKIFDGGTTNIYFP